MRRLRYWLIRKLAGDDEVYVNCRFDCGPDGVFVGENIYGKKLFFTQCTFTANPDLKIETKPPFDRGWGKGAYNV